MERRERVQQLLLERQQRLGGSRGGGGSSVENDENVPSGDGGGGNGGGAVGGSGRTKLEQSVGIVTSPRRTPPSNNPWDSPSHPGAARAGSFRSPSHYAEKAATPTLLAADAARLETTRQEPPDPGKSGPSTSARPARPASAPRERSVNTTAMPFNLSASRGGRHSREAIAAKLLKEASENLTFKPKTLSRPSTPLRREVGASGKERIAQLSTPRTAQWEKYEKIRAEHKAEETKDCTFRPTIGRKPRKMAEAFAAAAPSQRRTLIGAAAATATSITDRSSMPFPERLYLDADNRYRARESAKRQLAEAEIASYPFQPAINDNSRAAAEAEGYRPIHERVGELLRKKQEALAAARVQVELENPDLTFQPRVSDASRAIARGLEEEAGMDPRERIDRLAAGQSFTSDRALRRSMSTSTSRGGRRGSRGGGGGGHGGGEPDVSGGGSGDRGEVDEHTFAPRLNENTRRLCEMMAEEGVRGGPGSFLERQAEHANKSRKEKEEARTQYDDDCTFHPDTGNAEAILKKSTSKYMVRSGETPAELIARLAFLDSQQKQSKRHLAEETYYAQFTHRPAVSKAAQRLLATPLDELAVNDRGAAVRRAAEAEATAAFRAACTFEPNLGAKHADASPRPYQVDYAQEGGITARIREYRREKEICLQEARNEKEFKELEACTFQPNVNKRPLAGSGGAAGAGSGVGGARSVAEVVNGLGRHLELRRRAKQLEDEARARAAKVFHEDAVKKDISHRQTIPVPYNISALGEAGLKSELRRQRLLAEKEVRDMRSCTFQPKTNERPRKELIERLLAEDEANRAVQFSPFHGYAGLSP